MPILLPFQEIGARNLASQYHHLLADAPGLGKTPQAVVAAGLVCAKSVLVICPASVRTHWRDEVVNWGGDLRAWRVISYNEASHQANFDNQRDFDVLILDEAHFLKTIDSQRTRAIFGSKARDGFDGLARRARYKWCLTGTPAPNRPRELYPILKNLHPHFASVDFSTFARLYCGAYFDGYGMNTKGASRTEELAGILGSFMTRRTKADVFPGRKEADVQLVPLDLTEKDLQEVKDEEELILNREDYLSPVHEQFGDLGDLSRLLRLTGEAKVPASIRYLVDILETVEKVVIFFHHTSVGRRLYAACAERGWKPAILQGGMSDTQKDEAKENFINGNGGCRVFLGQIQAAGTGVDGLQEECSEVVFVEQPWVPGTLGQAIDRLDRMGQAAEYVTARVLHAPGTLESAVLCVRNSKIPIIETLMGRKMVS